MAKITIEWNDSQTEEIAKNMGYKNVIDVVENRALRKKKNPEDRVSFISRLIHTQILQVCVSAAFKKESPVLQQEILARPEFELLIEATKPVISSAEDAEILE